MKRIPIGSGCKTCPVNPCETLTYRGSTCAAQRAKHGLGDPLTHADRIRAMSDEELAAWMAECNAYGEHADASQWLPWLQEPVKDQS